MNLKLAFSWTLASVSLRYLIKLVGNLTLARLLTPEDFGLVAIVIAVVSGLEAITDVGTRASLIRSPRNDDPWLDTAWTLGVVRGLAIGFIIVVAAYPIGLFLDDLRLVPLIAACGSMSIFIGMTSVTSILVVRDLQMKRLAIVEMAVAIVGYLVMLGWAMLYPSPWALLSGAIVSTGAFTLASFVAFGKRPLRLRWDPLVISELVGFGKWVLAASLLGVFIMQGDRFIVGKFVGITEVGIYSIAITWAAALQSLFGMFLSRLYLPVVANLGRNLEHEGIRRMRQAVLFAMIVPFAFTAGYAELMIRLLYPSEYVGAGKIMQVLVIGAWFSTMEFLYNDQLMIEGRPEHRFKAQVVSVLIMLIALSLMRSELTTVGIAWIFTAGAASRAIFLSSAAGPSLSRERLLDYGLTTAFLGLTAVFSGAGSRLSPAFGTLSVLVTAFVVFSPLGAAIALFSLRQIFRISRIPEPNLGPLRTDPTPPARDPA